LSSLTIDFFPVTTRHLQVLHPTRGALEELVCRTRAGSQEAETALHARYHGYVLEVIGMAVFRKIQEGAMFANERKFLAFPRVITRNCFLKPYRNHILRAKRSLNREVRLNPTAHDRPAVMAVDPVETTADEEK
jgi:hypothetical protein